MSRYGESIERDLSFFHHGLDLLDLWRNDEERKGRPPLSVRKVLAYIDGLPSYSAFIEASAQDDEVAEMYAAQHHDSAPVAPRITEWTPERAELVRVTEALQALTALVSSALGGNPRQPTPLPRPETAADRLAAKVESASYDYLLERIAEAQREGGD